MSPNVTGSSTNVGVSLKPSDAVAGGGMLDGVDVVLKKVRVELTDYEGTIDTAQPAIIVIYATDEGDEYKAQIYTAGDVKHFVPDDQGRKFVPVSGKKQLSDNCNAIIWLSAMVTAGFPEDKIGDDVTVFEGTKIHVMQIPAPKRPGLDKEGGKNKTLAVAQKILKLPWEGKGPAKVSKLAAAVAQMEQGQTAPDPGFGNGKAVEGLLAILLGKGGQISKAQIAQEAFKHFAKDPDRNVLVQTIFKDEFLKQGGVPWTYDGTMVKLSQ